MAEQKKNLQNGAEHLEDRRLKLMIAGGGALLAAAMLLAVVLLGGDSRIRRAASPAKDDREAARRIDACCRKNAIHIVCITRVYGLARTVNRHMPLIKL